MCIPWNKGIYSVDFLVMCSRMIDYQQNVHYCLSKLLRSYQSPEALMYKGRGLLYLCYNWMKYTI